MSINTKMTTIADEIRTLSGTTGTMGLDTMAININEANVEVNNQAEIMAQIMSALEGKAIDGPSDSGVTFVTGDFTYTSELSGPDTYNFILTSDTLQSSTRQIIIVFINDVSGYSEAWKIFCRTDLKSNFDEYNGSNSYLLHGMNTTVSENDIEVVETMVASDTFANFWFIAI